jgi:hypothetical protein
MRMLLSVSTDETLLFQDATGLDHSVVDDEAGRV